MVRSCLWKTLVGTVQRPGVSFLGEARGAYVNVVASAADLSELQQKVKLALDELGLDLIEMDDAEVLPVVLSKARVSEEVITMAKTVRKVDSVAFGTFYVFDETPERKPVNP
jgi:hypothetical protein